MDVQAGAEDPALAQRLVQRLAVDDRATGGVDQDGGRLHQRQLAAADEAACLGCIAQVERDDVGLTKDLVPFDQLDAAGGGPLRVVTPAPANRAHAKALTHPGEDLSNHSQPDKPHRPAAQLRTADLLPDALPHPAVAEWNRTGHRQG